jgi:glutamine synthetase adenylyltransferase
VRKLINWLTVKTGEGDLYEIDTALRPNGNSGLLVTTFDAYANYQQQRGSNTAWTWEHQAMTRARFVLGEPALQASASTSAPGRHHRATRHGRAARRDHGHARQGAQRPPGEGRRFRRQAQPRRHGRCGVLRAVPGAVAVRRPP